MNPKDSAVARHMTREQLLERELQYYINSLRRILESSEDGAPAEASLSELEDIVSSMLSRLRRVVQEPASIPIFQVRAADPAEITKLRDENRLLHGFVESMGYEMITQNEHGVIFRENSA